MKSAITYARVALVILGAVFLIVLLAGADPGNTHPEEKKTWVESNGPWMLPTIGALLIALMGNVVTTRQSNRQWRERISEQMNKQRSDFQSTMESREKMLNERTDKLMDQLDRRLIDTESRLANADHLLRECKDNEARLYSEVQHLKEGERQTLHQVIDVAKMVHPTKPAVVPVPIVVETKVKSDPESE